jgi:hypothetical protein
MMKSKSSEVRTVYILVMVAFDFFWKEGFRGEPFLFFEWSSSSLGGVTFLGLYLASTSSPPPRSGDVEVVFPEVFLKFWTSSVFFCLLVSSVFCSLWLSSGLSISDISAGLTGIRRSSDHSLVISSRSSSISL